VLWLAAATALVHLQQNGALVRPGHDDARTLTSSIVDQAVQAPAWDVSDEVWNATVACLRRVYAPFDVEFTETDPGDVPHVTGIFGGSPHTFGFAAGSAGMAPFKSDCSVIENAVVFVFTDAFDATDANLACHIMAQELGHSFGLDHALAEGDPMSTQTFDAEPMFLDEDVACGERAPRPCGLPGKACRETQNSYALLMDRLGAPGDESSLVVDHEATTVGGCTTTGSPAGLALGLLALRSRRRGAGRSRPDRPR
jgi:hypothetical protein